MKKMNLSMWRKEIREAIENVKEDFAERFEIHLEHEDVLLPKGVEQLAKGRKNRDEKIKALKELLDFTEFCTMNEDRDTLFCTCEACKKDLYKVRRWWIEYRLELVEYLENRFTMQCCENIACGCEEHLEYSSREHKRLYLEGRLMFLESLLSERFGIHYPLDMLRVNGVNTDFNYKAEFYDKYGYYVETWV